MAIAEEFKSQFEYIQKKIQRRLDIYDHKERWCWWYTVAIRVTGFGLSAAITIIAGWGSNDFTFQKNALLVLGAASTFLASVAAFWNIERYWLENRVIFEGLRELRDRIHYVQNRHSAVTDPELFAIWSDYEKLLARRADYWTNRLRTGAPTERTAAKGKETCSGNSTTKNSPAEK
jgi:hypothetical protein